MKQSNHKHKNVFFAMTKAKDTISNARARRVCINGLTLVYFVVESSSIVVLFPRKLQILTINIATGRASIHESYVDDEVGGHGPVTSTSLKGCVSYTAANDTLTVVARASIRRLCKTASVCQLTSHPLVKTVAMIVLRDYREGFISIACRCTQLHDSVEFFATECIYDGIQTCGFTESNCIAKRSVAFILTATLTCMCKFRVSVDLPYTSSDVLHATRHLVGYKGDDNLLPVLVKADHIWRESMSIFKEVNIGDQREALLLMCSFPIRLRRKCDQIGSYDEATDLFLNMLADELYFLMRLVDFAVATSASELAFSSQLHNSYITLLFLSYCIWEQEHETLW